MTRVSEREPLPLDYAPKPGTVPQEVTWGEGRRWAFAVMLLLILVFLALVALSMIREIIR